jgi:hypothetical protein
LLQLQPLPSLKDFHTTPSNKKHGISILPSEEYRLKEEEIQSEEEFKRESQATNEENDNSENDFVFDDTKRKLFEQS